MNTQNPIDPIALILERNAFYRRMQHTAFGILVFTVVVIITLIMLLLYLLKNPRLPLFFAADEVGRLIKIIPVTQPNMTTEEVMSWTIEAVRAAFSYDFINYRAQLQSAQKYFTPYGWQNYMNALKASNNFTGLQQRKMIFLADVVQTPKLVTEGLLGGAYAWKFDMLVLVNYWLPPFTEQSKFANPLVVSVIVQRQEILQSYRGLGIVQIVGDMAITPAAQPQEISATPQAQ